MEICEALQDDLFRVCAGFPLRAQSDEWSHRQVRREAKSTNGINPVSSRTNESLTLRCPISVAVN